MQINCKAPSIVKVQDLKPHPKNSNKHPMSQIIHLAKILKYNGWRVPIVVSNQSGYIVSGHCRLEAAKYNDWTEVPVDYQDFDTPAAEYAHLTADNAISLQAELDIEQVKADVVDIGDDIDFEMLGLIDFENKFNIDEYDIKPVAEVDLKKDKNKYLVEIEFFDEDEQKKIYEEMLDRDYIARLKS